jgi:poly [ADP-ribose] polymerase 6/8
MTEPILGLNDRALKYFGLQMSDESEAAGDDEFPPEETQQSDPDNGEEYIIDPQDDDLLYESQNYHPGEAYSQFSAVINTYSAFRWDSPAVITGHCRFDVDLGRDFLPLSMQAVYGFLTDSVLLHITIELTDYNWNRRPVVADVRHPRLDNSFIGRPLVMGVIDDFFCGHYHPRTSYRSEPLFLTPTGTPDRGKLDQLLRQGFEESGASKALVRCGNDLNRTIAFLRTGEISLKRTEMTIDYQTCPLLFLMLEIADAFLDLADHCCICRAPLPPGLKPSVCTNQLCNFQLSQIGVGNSVYQEIARDILAADLVLSVFSASVNTDFQNPSPPSFVNSEIVSILQGLPSMYNMARQCQNDHDLSHLIGPRSLDLLRWVLLSNRSHLISLPNELRLPEFNARHQFMTLISTPEAEQVFYGLKQACGAMYLWHGSHGARWHSILRNGLKNATGTSMQANGAALGPGIYFARNSGTSWGYAKPAPNRYSASVIGNQVHILALCEVALVWKGGKPPKPSKGMGMGMGMARGQTGGGEGLADFGWAHTLTREEACVVRFLMIGGSDDVDVVAAPPRQVPTLRDVLNFLARAK